MKYTGCNEVTSLLSAEGRSPTSRELFFLAESNCSFLLLTWLFFLFFFFFLPFGSSLPSCLWSCFLILKPVSIWPCREVAVWAPLAPSAGSCHILRSELASTAIVAPGSSEPWNFHSRSCSLSVVLERVSWFSAIPKGVQVVLPLLCVGNQSAVSGKFASAVSESKH